MENWKVRNILTDKRLTCKEKVQQLNKILAEEEPKRSYILTEKKLKQLQQQK